MFKSQKDTVFILNYLLLFLNIYPSPCLSLPPRKSAHAWFSFYKPFIPVTEVFAGDLINNKGDKMTTDDVKGKVLGLYFSAHWVRTPAKPPPVNQHL